MRHAATALVAAAFSLVSVAGPGTVAGVASPASQGTWMSVPPPAVPRSYDHTATLLGDGRVLVVGGASCGADCNTRETGTRAVELFDPATRRWSPTGSTVYPRMFHSATLLVDGRVLVAGGGVDQGGSDFSGSSATAEIYSPRTGRWEVTGSLHHVRLGHTATRLSSGRVLVVGGSAGSTWLDSTEIFDPATGTWSDGPPLHAARAEHTATLLRDGTVLVAGGRDAVGRSNDGTPALNTAEIYSPATGTWRSVPHLFRVGRVNHTAVLLADGRVLLAGGAAIFYHGGRALPTDTVDVYDPATRGLSASTPLPQARFASAATLLHDGRVLEVGGYLKNEAVRISRVTKAPPLSFDPGPRSWSAVAPMLADPSTHTIRRFIESRAGGDLTATRLPNGMVLVVGGDDAAHSAEIFDPGEEGAAASGSTGAGPIVWLAAAGAGVLLVAAALLVRALRRR